VVSAQGNPDIRQYALNEADDPVARIILPGHGGKTDNIRSDFSQGVCKVFSDRISLSYEIYQINLMPIIDITTDAGNPMVRHMDCLFMNDDGNDIRHGNEHNLHAALSVLLILMICPDTCTTCSFRVQPLFNALFRYVPANFAPDEFQRQSFHDFFELKNILKAGP
jgi:hypothetical protein